MRVQAETASLSKAGGRKINQDFCGYHSNLFAGCWIVADGLGGHAGGETASRIAVETVLEVVETQPPDDLSGFLSCSFVAAQQSIRRKASEDDKLSSMRTTIVMLCRSQQSAQWAHVGDSRLYWFRAGKILQQTRDHSVPQLLADAGKISQDEVRGHEDQNRLTRAVGQDGILKPTISTKLEPILNGDVALLCSDGIWTHVLEKELEETLAKSGSCSDWLMRLEKLVLKRARGEFDNYSAIAVRFSILQKEET